MQAFFLHYSTKFGIAFGLDMEQDYEEFVEKNKETYEQHECLTYEEEEISVSEWDIFLLAQNKLPLNEAAKGFKNYLIERANLYKDKPWAIIMSSMHSGSSDYLTVSKILNS